MSSIKVRVGQQNTVKVASALIGSRISLEDLINVNAVTPSDGMILIYNAATKKWDATLSLTPGNTQNLDINGGTF
jgi:hypothetical protein